jgi:OPA family glycerol-3-phosphate transporter-like MFS transporter
MTVRQILFENVFNNKLLWLIAIANAFIYFVRYGVLDWAPSYLTTPVAEGGKGMALNGSSWSYFMFEIAGIFGTILCGILSDKLFKGRRAPATIIYMALVALAVYVYWKSGSEWVVNCAMATIGFLIYGPVMLIGVSALDLVPKKAAGTAAGFTGLFGYLIGSALLANIGMGYIFKHFGWDGGFVALIVACGLAILFSASTWNKEKEYIA